MPFTPRNMLTSPPGSWLLNGKKTPAAVFSRSAYFSITSPKWGDPSSSSPSATTIRLTGSRRWVAMMDSRALRKARSGAFWLVAPRAISTLPRGRSTRAPSNAPTDHPVGSTGCTSYIM